MRTLLLALIAFLISVALFIFVIRETGFVLISLNSYSIKLSLFESTSLFFILSFTLFLFLRILVNITGLPERWAEKHIQNNKNLAKTELEQGLIHLVLGEWQKSERTLMATVNSSEFPMINYLAAAKAAQMRNNDIRRDEYLRLALEKAPNAEIAVNLCKAKLQIAYGQKEQALTTFLHLRGLVPENNYLVIQVANLFYALEKWELLHDFLPVLRKNKVLLATKLSDYERKTNLGLMAQHIRDKNHDSLSLLWNDLSNCARIDESIVSTYACYLVDQQEPGNVERVIREALNQNWSEHLVNEYGRIETDDPSEQLAHAESWLAAHEDSAVLLRSLGRICRQTKLWGRARSYFETSIAIQPLPETYQDLADLLGILEDKESSQECYKKGLELAVDGFTRPLQTRAEKYAKSSDPEFDEALSKTSAFTS